MADTTALKNRIRAAIKANDNQEITGPVLQQSLLDIVDELDLNPELENEISARQNGDSTLQQGINTERQARIDADNALGQRITDKINSINASNVAYNHNDSKLDATNVQQAVDEVRKRSNYNDGDNIIDFNTIHLITDNPEFVCVAVDVNEKILYGIKTDGQPYFGVGCPQQVKDYIDKQINKILGTDDVSSTIDSLKEIEAFLKDFTNSDTLKALLDTKANKTDVDNSIASINTDIADKYKKSNPNDNEGNVVDTNTIVSIENNPEYIKVITDNVGKLIEAIGIDGIRKFFAGIEVQGTLQCVTDNPEYIAVWLDSQERIIFGFKINGDPYFGYGIPSQINSIIETLKSNTETRIDALQQSIDNNILDLKANIDEVKATTDDIYKKSNPNDKEGNVVDTNTIVSVEDNPEYIKALTDSVGKLIEAIGLDGVRKFFAGINIQGVSQCVTDNPEYIVAWLDNQDKIIFAIENDGDPYFGYGVPSQIVEYVNDKITQINGSITAIEAFLEGFTDTTLLHYLNENYGEYIDDIENRIEVKTDSKKKIISYRSEDGMLHESVGINTPVLMAEKIISPSIGDVELTTVTDTIYVERPKFGEIWFEGNLPTDMSDNRTPSRLTMTFKNSGVAQFKCNCTLAIQGHGSATYSKKGYTLEPYNANKEHISIKFGDMIAIDSFHLKAYATDSLHCRDMANFNIWRNIIQSLGYPYSKMNNIPYELTDSYNKNIIDIADAKYAPDGFPCVCYLNGKFLGLYTIKLKKSRQNYAMEKSIKSEIFLDATNEIVGGVSVSSLNTQFIYEGWDLKNPKLKKYEEGGEIPDANVLASIERLFDFTSSWDSSDQTSVKGYENYIVLPHWLAFVIFEELVFSEDSVRNNINVVTWDNTHWSVIPYDTDLSYGLHAWNHTLYGPDRMNKFVQDGDIWPAFRSLFQIQLRELWTSLRRSGVITFEKIYGAYKAQCDSIPRDIYADDYKKWGTIWQNGIPSMEQLATNIAARIEWLDSQWLNQNN